MKLLMSHGADPGDAMLIAVDVGFRVGIKLLYNSDKTLINLPVLSKHFQVQLYFDGPVEFWNTRVILVHRVVEPLT